jgi:Ulp1 family protease
MYHHVAVLVDVEGQRLICFDSMLNLANGKPRVTKAMTRLLRLWQEMVRRFVGIFGGAQAAKRWSVCSAECPLQTNSRDCGPLTCAVFDVVSRAIDKGVDVVSHANDKNVDVVSHAMLVYMDKICPLLGVRSSTRRQTTDADVLKMRRQTTDAFGLKIRRAIAALIIHDVQQDQST